MHPLSKGGYIHLRSMGAQPSPTPKLPLRSESTQRKRKVKGGNTLAGKKLGIDENSAHQLETQAHEEGCKQFARRIDEICRTRKACPDSLEQDSEEDQKNFEEVLRFLKDLEADINGPRKRSRLSAGDSDARANMDDIENA